MGLAYIGKPVNRYDALQTVHTLFYPRLHPVTTRTLQGNHTVHYVVGNKTHFTGKEEPIYVCAEELLKFATLLCVDMHYQTTFDHVKEWKNGNFYNILGDSWAKTLLSANSSHHTKETTTLLYQPVSIPLNFGYAWDKYPIRMSPPPHWPLIKQRKAILLNFERQKRSQRSKKIKASKAANPKVQPTCTVHDDISVSSKDSLDSTRISISPSWEQEWVDAEWHDQYPYASSTALVWAFGLQALQHHIFLEDDWSRSPKGMATRPQNFNFQAIKSIYPTNPLPLTTYQVMHYIILKGDPLSTINLHQDRTVDTTTMACETFNCSAVDNLYKTTKTQWQKILTYYHNDRSFFHEHTHDWRINKPYCYVKPILPPDINIILPPNLQHTHLNPPVQHTKPIAPTVASKKQSSMAIIKKLGKIIKPHKQTHKTPPAAKPTTATITTPLPAPAKTQSTNLTATQTPPVATPTKSLTQIQPGGTRPPQPPQPQGNVPAAPAPIPLASQPVTQTPAIIPGMTNNLTQLTPILSSSPALTSLTNSNNTPVPAGNTVTDTNPQPPQPPIGVQAPPNPTQPTHAGGVQTPNPTPATTGHRFYPWTGKPIYTQPGYTPNTASTSSGKHEDTALFLTDEEIDTNANTSTTQSRPKRKKVKKT